MNRAVRRIVSATTLAIALGGAVLYEVGPEWRPPAMLVDAGPQVTGTQPSPTPAGCRIKANISENGRIFHVPGQQHYEETRINLAAGERWFCSEAAASAAGWRKAKR